MTTSSFQPKINVANLLFSDPYRDHWHPRQRHRHQDPCWKAAQEPVQLLVDWLADQRVSLSGPDGAATDLH